MERVCNMICITKSMQLCVCNSQWALNPDSDVSRLLLLSDVIVYVVLCNCPLPLLSLSLSLCIYLYITRGESRFLPHALTNLHSLITWPSLYCAACFFDVLQIPLPAPFVNELISVAGGGGEVVGGGK